MKSDKKTDSSVNIDDVTNAENYNKNSPSAIKDDNSINRITFEFNKKGIKSTTKYIVGIAFIIIAITFVINNDVKVSGIINAVYKLISPFLLGSAIAFVLNVLLRPIENLWLKIFKKNGKVSSALKRPVSLILSILILVGLLAALLFMIIPDFIDTFNNIVAVLPDYSDRVIGWFESIRTFATNHGVMIPELKFNPDTVINFIKTNFANQSTLDKTLDFTSSLVTGIVNFIVAIAFSVYLLSQKEKLADSCKKVLYAFFKKQKVDRFLNVAEITDQTFTNFISGQLVEAVIIGVLCFIGMLIFGMPYAPVISVLVGFTALIPVFGAFIGTAIGAFLILFISPAKALWFVIFIVILQQIEGNLIYPKVVGKSVGLPGIWVLGAVTIGGNTMGVIGIILAVPACAVFYTLLRETVYKRIRRQKSGIPISEESDK
ncbi:MAG: AI-2E family transporter [Clostridia bacterium]|nr:AI-2E family transporter [Clostridia bacterium]